MTAPGRGFEQGGPATVTGMLAAAEFARGDLVAGRFRIERLLGMGGMGLVFLARDEQLGVDVALKLLRPELAARPDAFDRFRQELLLARQVSSPNVVRIHDLVQHGTVWLLSMDFVPGRSLQQLLDERGTLPPDEAVEIARQIAVGLAAAHQRGVIHRDLKPANILVTDQGEALITDFGVARSAGATGLTLSGTIVGTPEYLSPEQARAEPTDARSDLYALGLILHEMLTGIVPFAGGTPAEMLAQRIVRSPPPVDSVKPGLPSLAVALCTRLLDVRPSRRFPDASSMVRAIEAGRVPGAHLQRVRAPLRYAALVATALLVIAAPWAWQRWVQSPVARGTALVAPLELAVLAVQDASDPAFSDLARGVQLELDMRLLEQGVPVADPARIERTLRELDATGDRANRMRKRVATALGAESLLLVDVTANEPRSLRFILWDADSDVEQWTEQMPVPIDGGRLDPAAWRRLATRLLPQPASRPMPAANALRALSGFAPASGRVPPPNSPDGELPTHGWWWLLETMEREGQSAAAQRIARDALNRFAKLESPDALRVRAQAEYLTGEPDAALALVERIAAGPHDHPVALLRARILLALGSYEEAASVLRGVTDADARNIDAWFLLGKALLMQGEAQSAMDDALTRALVGANRLADARIQAEVANAMGIGYRQLGQLDQSAEQFERAVLLRGRLSDERGVGISLRNLSAVRSIQGRFDEAEDLLARARGHLEPLGDPEAMGHLGSDVGLLAEERGDFPAALAAYREALRLRQAVGDEGWIGESLINVAFAYYQLGEFDNAQVFYQQAMQTYSQIEDKAGAIRASQGMGLAELARGSLQASRRLVDSSLRDAETLQMREEQSTALATLAEIDRIEGSYIQSRDRAVAARDMFEARGETRGALAMRLLLAQLWLDLGDPAAASQEIAAIAPGAVTNQEQRAMLHLRLGEIALQGGDFPGALEESGRALEVARRSGAAQAEINALLLEARSYRQQGSKARSLRSLDTAGTALTRFASVPLRLSLLEARLEIAPEASTYNEARTLIARLPAYGREWRVAQLAQRAALTPADAIEAAERFATAYDRVRAKLPEDLQASLEALAAADRRDLEKQR